MLTSYQNLDDARDPNYIGFIIDSNENDLEIEIYKWKCGYLKMEIKNILIYHQVS